MPVTFRNFFAGLARSAPSIAEILVQGRMMEKENMRQDRLLKVQEDKAAADIKESGARTEMYAGETELNERRLDAMKQSQENRESIMNKIREIEFTAKMPDPVKRTPALSNLNKELSSLVEQGFALDGKYGDLLTERERMRLQKTGIMANLMSTPIWATMNDKGRDIVAQKMRDGKYGDDIDAYLADVAMYSTDQNALKQIQMTREMIKEVRDRAIDMLKDSKGGATRTFEEVYEGVLGNKINLGWNMEDYAKWDKDRWVLSPKNEATFNARVRGYVDQSNQSLRGADALKYQEVFRILSWTTPQDVLMAALPEYKAEIELAMRTLKSSEDALGDYPAEGVDRYTGYGEEKPAERTHSTPYKIGSGLRDIYEGTREGIKSAPSINLYRRDTDE